MPKLGVFSGADVCRVLGQHGFAAVRQRGSHVVMQKQVGTSTVTVPVPLHPELKVGTLLCIIRQSGLSRALFER
jgi:predicted RNA binding protein YcfA (HicA-like mRNA interferase family)